MRTLWSVLLACLALPLISNAQLPSEDLQGYVYVEAFEVRKEFALFLRAEPEWKDKANQTINASQQAELLEQYKQRLKDACPLEIDGAKVAMELDRIGFVRVVDPTTGVQPDDREEIPVSEALLGVVFAIARDGYPESMQLTWDYFPERIETVPVVFVSPSQRKNFQFSPAETVQSWTLSEDSALPSLLKVPDPPAMGKVAVPVLSLILIVAALGLGIATRIRKQLPLSLSVAAVFCVLGSFLFWNVATVQVTDPFAEELVMNEQDARKLVLPLLRNIYHAFDYRDESRIYDTLASSVTGDLLEEIYLEIRRGLVLEEQGGPRVKVSNVDLREVSAESIGERVGVRADAEWIALGTVTHWGHEHQRFNKYHAWITIEPIDGEWKVTEIEIIEEGRLG